MLEIEIPNLLTYAHQAQLLLHWKAFQEIWQEIYGFTNVLEVHGYTIRSKHWSTDLRALHTRDWVPVTINYTSCTLIGGKGGSELVQVHFTLHLRDQQSVWMQDGCKVYMDSYMSLNGSCFMVTWTIFRNHLSELGLHKTMRPWHSECSQSLISSNLLS